MATASGSRQLTDAQLRRWLTLLRQPDRLADPEFTSLLELHGRLPETSSSAAIGRAAADLLRDGIERLRPPPEASRQEQLPYLVLRTCFLDGSKLFQAAAKLGISERQLSRERSRAIALLRAELEATETEVSAPYRAEPIPTILGFMPRPLQASALREAVARHRLVHVEGPPGIGKTTLVAEIADELSGRAPVLWYRFRTGINDSPAAVLFELGEYLRHRGRSELASYMAEALPSPDPALATRLAMKSLSGSPHLLIFDDYHVASGDGGIIGGLLEEAVTRLRDLQIITISRQRAEQAEIGANFPVPPLKLSETTALLQRLGVEPSRETSHAIHAWTDGIPHLVKLAASWLKTASPAEVDRGIESLQDLDEVQHFLLDSVTELMEPGDRAILGAASVFRDRFTDDALAFVAERTRGEVQDASRRLVRSYLATRGRAGDVAFFHATIRDYVYSRLGEQERAHLHERAAIWYRRTGEPDEATWHRAQTDGSSSIDDDDARPAG